MVNRIVTGSHFGLRDWLVQRISAVMMVLYAFFMMGYVLVQPVLDYNAWTLLFASDLVRSFTFLMLLALFYHAWIGVRDVVMDYIKPAFVRLMIHVLVVLSLILYMIWSVQILWGM